MDTVYQLCLFLTVGNYPRYLAGSFDALGVRLRFSLPVDVINFLAKFGKLQIKENSIQGCMKYIIIH